MIRHLFDCPHPQLVQNRYTGDLIQVPCGKCPSCQRKHITRYVAPLIREATAARYTYFITLTYKKHKRPIADLFNYHVEPKYYESFSKLFNESLLYLDFVSGKLPVCSVVDVQKFVKRLRENIFRQFGLRNAFRYAISGDYGSTAFAPHYHGLLFFNDKRIADACEALVRKSWSDFNRSLQRSESLGRIDCQPAYGAAEYVSAYVNSTDERPSILEFRDFAPKMLHSSSLGSCMVTYEQPSEIVQKGLTTVHVYDSQINDWKETALLPNMVRRLFPRIPRFCELDVSERLSVYRFFEPVLEFEAIERRKYLMKSLFENQFVYDYLCCNQDITFKRVVDAIERIFFIVRQVYIQKDVFDCSLKEYDSYIDRFYSNRRYISLINQLSYEQDFHSFSRGRSVNDMLNAIDLARVGNKRNLLRVDKCSDFINVSESSLSPYEFDKEYFKVEFELRDKLVKRKLNNSYLDKHPEFKKFHS